MPCFFQPAVDADGEPADESMSFMMIGVTVDRIAVLLRSARRFDHRAVGASFTAVTVM